MKNITTLAFAALSLTLIGCSNNMPKGSSASVSTPEEL